MQALLLMTAIRCAGEILHADMQRLHSSAHAEIFHDDLVYEDVLSSLAPDTELHPTIKHMMLYLGLQAVHVWSSEPCDAPVSVARDKQQLSRHVSMKLSIGVVVLQIWESGFISIPHTFEVADLGKTLPQLLPSFAMGGNGTNRADSRGTSRLDRDDGCTSSGESGNELDDIPSDTSNGAANGDNNGGNWWGEYDTHSINSSPGQQRSEQAVSSARHCVASKPMQSFHAQVRRRRLHVPQPPKPWMKPRIGLLR